MEDKNLNPEFENQDSPAVENAAENDAFVIGKGFKFEEDQNETKNGRKKSKKKKSTARSIIWIVCIFAVSISLAFGIIYLGADLMGIGFGRGEEVEINIEKGSTVPQIAEELEECGAIKSTLSFRLYAKLKGYETKFQYGYYQFNNEAGYEALSQMLMNEGAKAESITVTIPEGTGINDYVKNVNGEKVTVKGIGTILEEKGVCSKSDFISALHDVEYKSKLLKNANVGKTYFALEGYLFPETYDFYSYESKECAAFVVDKMIKETEERITEDMYKSANEMGYSMNEILTMASIIQMEAGNATEAMPDVAAVFYNRLKSDAFATLGSSPTCYYGTFYKNDDGRYNTYNIPGLPPGPICSPGIDAIKAALYPTEDHEYYYFVTDAKGNFYFHKTLAEQNKTIAKLKQDKNWVYEYFD